MTPFNNLQNDLLTLRIDELRTKISVLALTGFTLIRRSDFHYQLLHSKRILANIWPSKLKLLRWWPMPAKTAVQFKDWQAVIAAVLVIIKEHAATDPKPPKRKPEPVPEPALQQDEFYVDFQRRLVRADLTLEGNELRIIINGSTFSDSFRLSAADTVIFLQKAGLARDTIQQFQHNVPAAATPRGCQTGSAPGGAGPDPAGNQEPGLQAVSADVRPAPADPQRGRKKDR